MTSYPKLDQLEITHPQLQDAIDAAYEWADRMNNGEKVSILYAGPTGIGKSHIAESLLWSIRFMPEGMPDQEVPTGRYYKAADLIVQLGAVTDDYGNVMTAKPDFFTGDSEIIVIDDIGAQVNLPFVGKDILQDEIQVRFLLFLEHCIRRTRTDWKTIPVGASENGMDVYDWSQSVFPDRPSLIMTTNLDIGSGDADSEFAQYVGERNWSRIQELCPKGFLVNMRDVPDYRQRRGE
jgi:DNA replication protein DnaC